MKAPPRISYPLVHSRRLLTTLLTGIVCTAAGLTSANATLLVYEGFDYNLANGGILSGVTVSSDTIGLTGKYSYTSSNNAGGSLTPAASEKYTTTGLTFGNLETSGGALSLKAKSASAVMTVNTTAGSASSAGTYYNSYLIQYDALNTVVPSGTGPYAGERQNGSSMFSYAYYRNASGTGSMVGSGTPSGNGFGSGFTPSLNTTYLIVSRYTSSLFEEFVFTLADYNAWVSDGAQESNLYSYYSNYASLAFGQLNITLGGGGSNTMSFLIQPQLGELDATMDEMRWGTTLGDVLPMTVPEPSTVALLLGAVGLTFVHSAKRKRSYR